MQNATAMQVQPRPRSLPYGWVAAVAAVALVASIGLAHRPTPAPHAVVATGGSAAERAESAAIAAHLAASGVDLRPSVRRVEVRDDTATLTVDRETFNALSDRDQSAAFEAVAAAWTAAYRAQHRGTLDRPIALDFVDASNDVVHHRQIEPE